MIYAGTLAHNDSAVHSDKHDPVRSADVSERPLIATLSPTDWRQQASKTEVRATADVPNLELTDRTSKADGRTKVQEYVKLFANRFGVDMSRETEQKRFVSKAEIEQFASNPNLSPKDREMANFFSKNYDFVLSVPKYTSPVNMGSLWGSEERSPGIDRYILSDLASLTDPQDYRGMIKRDSFSLLSTFGTLTAGSVVGGSLAMAALETGSLVLLGATFATGLGAVALAVAAGVVVGNMVYGKDVREHYASRRRELERIMSA